MAAPKSKARALFEITVVAGTLFVVPLGYYYGRDKLINV